MSAGRVALKALTWRSGWQRTPRRRRRGAEQAEDLRAAAPHVLPDLRACLGAE